MASPAYLIPTPAGAAVAAAGVAGGDGSVDVDTVEPPAGFMFNPALLVQLQSNYRSHERILDMPSALFYGGEWPAQSLHDTVKGRIICAIA